MSSCQVRHGASASRRLVWCCVNSTLRAFFFVRGMNYAKPNRELPFREMGAGMALSFRCARCNLPKAPLGRRLQMVQGIKQFVCKGCVEQQAGAA